MKRSGILESLLLPVTVFISLAVIIVVQYWGYEKPPLGIDDANIYFVYMKNLATGHGLVWNVGDERVEGFTSLLWTLIGAGIYKLTPAHFALILGAVLFLLTYFTILKTLLFVRRVNRSTSILSYSDIIILSLLLLPLGFVEWNILSLMETGLWTFLLTSIMLVLAKSLLNDKPVKLPAILLLVALIDLTRPESIMFNGLFIVFLFIIYRQFTSLKKSFITVLPAIVLHAAVVLIIIKWRLSYFGYAFPNTYYAKVSSSLKDNISAGINYAFVFFYNYPLNVFILLTGLFFSLRIISKFRRTKTLEREEKIQLLLMAFILVILAMPALTGGDHFKYNRFYQVMLPLFFASICNTYCWNQYIKVQILSGRVEKAVLMVSFFGMLFLSAKYSIFDFIASQRRIVHYPVIQDFIVSKEGREVAEKMNATFAPTGNYPSVGTLATGGFGFIYKGKTVDLMGLNNTMMAHANRIKVGYRNHASFDKKVFYKLMPDMMGTFYGAQVVEDTTGFILPENKPEYRTDYANMVYGSFKQIYDDIKFRDEYTPVLLHNPKEKFFIFDYCSKSFLSTLSNSAIEVTVLKRNSLSEKFVVNSDSTSHTAVK